MNIARDADHDRRRPARPPGDHGHRGRHRRHRQPAGAVAAPLGTSTRRSSCERRLVVATSAAGVANTVMLDLAGARRRRRHRHVAVRPDPGDEPGAGERVRPRAVHERHDPDGQSTEPVNLGAFSATSTLTLYDDDPTPATSIVVTRAGPGQVKVTFRSWPGSPTLTAPALSPFAVIGRIAMVTAYQHRWRHGVGQPAGSGVHRRGLRSGRGQRGNSNLHDRRGRCSLARST